MINNKKKINKLSSKDLAVLIADALVNTELVTKQNLDKSIEIIINEIDARKAMGDY